MFRTKIIGMAAIVALLTGCGFQQAMRRGDKLAASGDWAGAYESYSAATSRKPEDPEAVQSRSKARDQVVDLALEVARTSLAASQYEVVIEALKRADTYDSDRPEVFALRRDTEEAMREALVTTWESGDARGTYALVVRTRTLFPKAPFLPATFAQLREHFAGRAEELLDDDRFDVALAAIRTITEFEPDRMAQVAPIEQKILVAWADDLSAQAVQYTKTRRPGAAAALYARAYELAGRRTELERAQQIAAQLGPQARLTLKLETTGVPARAAAMRTAILLASARIPDLGVVEDKGALGARVNFAPHRCTESQVVTPASVEYVSGQVQKPNPLYRELTAQLEAARNAERTARTDSEALWPQVQAAQATVGKYDATLTDLEKRHAEAKAALEQARTQHEGAKIKRDELDVQIEQARLAGSPTPALETQAAEIALRLSEWSGELIAREDAETAAQKRLDALAIERGPAVEAHARLKAGYEALVKDRTSAAQLAADLSAKLGTTPKTIWEDVHETLAYDVHDWVRSCTAPASASFAVRWPTEVPLTRSFSPKQEVGDRSHIGHTKAGLVEDKKLYPTSDTDLVAKSDGETARAIVEAIGTLADDYYERRVAETTTALASDPIDATTALVGLYVGAKGRLDAETVSAFSAHLKQQYGLEKLELLTATTSAP